MLIHKNTIVLQYYTNVNSYNLQNVKYVLVHVEININLD